MVLSGNNGNVKILLHAFCIETSARQISLQWVSRKIVSTDSQDPQDAGFEHEFGETKLKHI